MIPQNVALTGTENSTNVLQVQTKICIAVNCVGRVRIRESSQLGIGNRLDEGPDRGDSLAHVAVGREIDSKSLGPRISFNDGAAGAICLARQKVLLVGKHPTYEPSSYSFRSSSAPQPPKDRRKGRLAGGTFRGPSTLPFTLLLHHLQAPLASQPRHRCPLKRRAPIAAVIWKVSSWGE